MDKEKNMFWAFIWEHRKGFMAYVLTVLIFLTVFYLYRLHLEAVAYGTGLCLFLILILGCVDFVRYRAKQRDLYLRRSNIMLGVDHLPRADAYTEEQYQILLDIVQKDKEKNIADIENQKNDLSEYFTMWAHQIKTPIAATGLLLGELEQVSGEEESASAHERIMEIETELFKIRQYVDIVLQYLRLDSPSNDFMFRQYELDEIVRQAVHKYASMFIRKKLSLSYEPLNIKVLTDEKWLVFVVEQVLSNAIKYTREGSISIRMKTGTKNVLIIEDTGIGILPEDQPRVFDHGYTGCNGRSDKKATGIGLYLCRKVLKKMGHGISLQSEPGKGTKVLLDLSREES